MGLTVDPMVGPLLYHLDPSVCSCAAAKPCDTCP